ncbi:MAG: RNA polymerase sigma factor [Bacteroidales bacterium]
MGDDSQIEKKLIQQLRRGNKKAFKTLFDNYNVRLFQFALKYLKYNEDAEDLVHEVFLTIWEKRSSILSNTSFKAYLFTIAYNIIKKYFLKRSRDEKYKQEFATEFLLSADSVEDKIDYSSLLEEVDKIINLLPERRREIFILSRKEGLKNSEIAEQLGLSVQSVKNQLTIARKFVEDKVNDDNKLIGLLFLSLFV